MPHKLRASPNFALSQSVDGRAFVIGEVEPYPQYWLSERERLLFALFARRGGMKAGEAVECLLRLSDSADPLRERARIEKAVAGMQAAGVLIAPDGELSRYGRDMARDYLEHRPFPPTIAEHIAARTRLGEQGHVLDLAAGPGSLALELARKTPNVTIMELSRGFCAAAKAEAKQRGLELQAINESCNRLPQMDGEFDLITISQALHWLDDVQVCKGVCRNLAAGGSFVVIHCAMTLPPEHPLSYILGDSTPLGDKPAGPFTEEARALYGRLDLLFDALDTPEVARHDPGHARALGGRITGTGIDIFRQQRSMGEGFARAFLSDTHIAALGQKREAFWQDLSARCAAASADQLIGIQEFAVLHFRRGGERLTAADWRPGPVRSIGFPVRHG